MSDYVDRAQAWVAQDPDPETRAELQGLIDAGDEAGLAERFAGRLQFGTAGLRGLLGAGPMRMNRLVIREVSAGLADYVLAEVAGARERGVVIGHDARKNSRLFAEDAARVFAGRGLPVRLFDREVPTPVTAFAVTQTEAAAGVMVTASHNPPDYNGYKVYWSNGAQIIPPVDQGISAAIAAVGRLDEIPMPELAVLRAAGTLTSLGAEMEGRYLDGVRGLAVHAAAARKAKLTIAYTAMHGVGARFVATAMDQAGFHAFHSEPGQNDPDGEFPTVAFPNPEEEGAMDRVLALATEIGADLVLANDPDADRLAVAVPDGTADTGYRMLTGDQIGLVLADYLLTEGAGGDRMVASTIVSSQLLGEMARISGVDYAQTLTGFKWIADAGLRYVADTDGRFVMGYEEALGYTVGELVRDKDGVSAAVTFAELTAVYKSRGQSVLERIESIYRRFGLYLTQAVSLMLPGAEGVAQIGRAMASFRADPPAEVAGHAVVEIHDLAAGALGLPKGDVLIFILDGGRRIIMRPSGTEPKLKSYYEVCEPVATGESLSDARARAQRSLVALRDAHQKMAKARRGLV